MKDLFRDVPSVAVGRLEGHDGPVQAVRFTADGKYCLTAGHDRTVRLWNPGRVDPAAANMKKKKTSLPPPVLPIQTYSDGYTHEVTSLATSPQSNDASAVLVAGSDKTLVVTDLVTQKVLRRLQGHTGRINSVAMPFNQQLYLSASYDGTVRIWDGRNRSAHQPIQTFEEAKDSVTCVIVETNDDQKEEAFIRTASVDGVVRCYDVRKGLVTCLDLDNPVLSLAVTNDHKCLIASCLDGMIRLIRAKNDDDGGDDDESNLLWNTFEGHAAGRYALDCAITSNDEYIVTGSEDGHAMMYDLVKATTVQTLSGQHTRPTCAVAVHPQTSSVVVTGSYDGLAIVWANPSHDSYSLS